MFQKHGQTLSFRQLTGPGILLDRITTIYLILVLFTLRSELGYLKVLIW